MGLHYEFLPDEPIVIQTVDEDFNFSKDGITSAERTMEILNQQPEPIFFIFNLLSVKMSLDDLIAGATLATRQIAMFQHPKLREAIFITQSRMMDLAAKGLGSDTFGHIKLKVFKTLDEALDYARNAAQH